MNIAIFGPLPVKLPIKNLPKKNYSKFFDTMTTSQDMDEIDLFGKKLSKKAQL